MVRVVRMAGVALVAVGLALLVGFSVYAVRDERFQKAGLLKDRNPGNMLYESQYFAAATIHLFLVSGAVAGGLLALNGMTLFLVGSVVGRLGHPRLVAILEDGDVEHEVRA